MSFSNLEYDLVGVTSYRGRCNNEKIRNLTNSEPHSNMNISMTFCYDIHLFILRSPCQKILTSYCPRNNLKQFQFAIKRNCERFSVDLDRNVRVKRIILNCLSFMSASAHCHIIIQKNTEMLVQMQKPGQLTAKTEEVIAFDRNL